MDPLSLVAEPLHVAFHWAIDSLIWWLVWYPQHVCHGGWRIGHTFVLFVHELLSVIFPGSSFVNGAHILSDFSNSRDGFDDERIPKPPNFTGKVNNFGKSSLGGAMPVKAGINVVLIVVSKGSSR